MIGLLLKLDVLNGFICSAVHLSCRGHRNQSIRYYWSYTQRHISASGSLWALSASLDFTDAVSLLISGNPFHLGVQPMFAQRAHPYNIHKKCFFNNIYSVNFMP